MINLLTETIQKLKNLDKTTKDVLFVANETECTTWNNFSNVADFMYNNEHGLTIINPKLVIVGKHFWLERAEYDGKEWWAFKKHPSTLDKIITEKIELFQK